MSQYEEVEPYSDIKGEVNMKFVSFKEALNANVEGKTVSSWLDDETKPYNIHYRRYDELSKGLVIDKFVLLGDELTRFDELKWTINES